MRTLTAVAVVSLVASLLFGIAERADAQVSCVECNLTKRDCIKMGRLIQLGCKADCRQNAAPTELGACVHLCRDAYQEKKAGCRLDHEECHATCTPGQPDVSQGVDRSCLNGCTKERRNCVKTSDKAAKGCVRDCRKADDPAACFDACAADVEGIQTDCAATFDTCTASCTGSEPVADETPEEAPPSETPGEQP